MSNANRAPKGIPTGGQFTSASHSEPQVAVGGAESLPDVGTAGVEEIRALANHSDPIVRAELTSSPRIPDDVLAELAATDQPEAVRLAVVGTGYPGTGDRAAEDPSPLVRAMSLTSWNTSPENRERLGADADVQQVLEIIQS